MYLRNSSTASILYTLPNVKSVSTAPASTLSPHKLLKSNPVFHPYKFKTGAPPILEETPGLRLIFNQLNQVHFVRLFSPR